jgi:hypothetical protein
MNETIKHLPNGDFKVVKAKTPSVGRLTDGTTPPPAATMLEIQESWHKFKNYPTAIAPKKDRL